MDKVAKCPQCGSESRVVDTLSFIEKMIASYSKKQNEVADSKKNTIQLQEKISQYAQALNKAKIYINTQKERYKTHVNSLEKSVEESKVRNRQLDNQYNKILNDNKSKQAEIAKLKKNIETLQDELAHSGLLVENISHSEDFIPQEDYKPIVDWFAKKSIAVDIDMDAVDTRGFFDEVALLIGNNFQVLQSVLEQIRYIQREGYNTVKIPLENKTKEDISIIKNFCKEIYDYSFASKYFHDKKKNALYVKIQQATKVVNFFNGIWMEWFVYMMLLDLFEKREISHSLIKGLKITHKNRDKNELDIFFLAYNVPVCIECKSGEFRSEIDKYLKLKKRLGLNKENFILCAIGLDTMQTEGLSSTYDMTFANQNNLLQYIDLILTEAQENEFMGIF